ncbi:MAG: ArnT family glycosyltransferase [Microbacteriaceae bacterium]
MTERAPTQARAHPRRRFQPLNGASRWVRWSLAAVMTTSAVLYTVTSTSSGLSDYYATAAKSMAMTWKALFFGAFDPNATITLDKLAGFLVPQAWSINIFGFSPWALAFPQVIEGLITIAATYYVVSRWVGPPGGLVGATVMAFTPILVSMFTHPMEDSMLTMFMVLSIIPWQWSIETGKTRHLLLAGALVGLGFQAKMMQSWMILPAMALVFFLMAGGTRTARLAKLAAAGLVTVAVSLSWMVLISLAPASTRPYIDGSTNNNIFAMVFGYNGTNHFIHNSFPGALGVDPAPFIFGSGPSRPLIIKLIAHTPVKLLFPEYASQIGWLYPLVAAGLILGFAELRRLRKHVDAPQGVRVAVMFNTAVFLTFGVILGVISLPHTAYISSMAFPLAALSAIGAILLWRTANRPASSWRFALPATVAVQTVWSLQLLANYPAFALWMSVPIAVIGLGCAVVLFAFARKRVPGRRTALLAALTALGMALLGPFVWSVSTLNPAYAGSANDAYAGPRTASIFNAPLKKATVYGNGLDSNRVIPSTSALEREIYDYAAAHSPGSRYTLLTDTWRSASPMIMDGARKVLPVGGFTSRVSTPDLSQIQRLIADHQLRYVLLTGQKSKSSVSTPNIIELQNWVQSTCRMIPRTSYDPSASPSSTTPPDRLFDCAVG